MQLLTRLRCCQSGYSKRDICRNWWVSWSPCRTSSASVLIPRNLKQLTLPTSVPCGCGHASSLQCLIVNNQVFDLKQVEQWRIAEGQAHIPFRGTGPECQIWRKWHCQSESVVVYPSGSPGSSCTGRNWRADLGSFMRSLDGTMVLKSTHSCYFGAGKRGQCAMPHLGLWCGRLQSLLWMPMDLSVNPQHLVRIVRSLE